jgi:sortase A
MRNWIDVGAGLRAGARRWIEGGLLLLGIVLVLPWIVANVASQHLEAEARRALGSGVAESDVEATARRPEAGGAGGEVSAPGAPEAGALVGLLEVPALDISTPVLEGTDSAVLFRGAGHVVGTALPHTPGNVAIAAHRDLQFRKLERIALRDEIVLRSSQGVYRYEVDDIHVTTPDDLSVLDDRRQPTLTLITCYPFRWVGPAPERFIVRGRLITALARAAGPSSVAGPHD